MLIKFLNKSFAKRCLPPILLDQISFFRAVILRIKFRRWLNRNAELRNKYFGKRVYILGNGPSLNNFDLKMIHGHEVITMNHFELHPHKEEFKIVAHCIGEPYSSSTWENPISMLKGVKADTYWFNADAVEFFSKQDSYDVHYYLPGLRAGALILSGDDLTGVALQYQSTAQMAINIALFLGFKDIYLLGFDHDWLVTRGHSPHFYEERDGVDKADLSRFAYIDMIRISLNLFEIYVKLHQIAKKRDARIWNLSKPSYLDVFPTLEQGGLQKASST
jgi:hypothetical protein